MKFKVIEHKDRESWLQWRHNGIGSSDVPIIMGVSRFKSYGELLEEKSKPVVVETKDNEYIKDRGNRIEQVVRKIYSEELGLDFQPMSCESIEYPFMRTTLDGVDPGLNLLLEIKLLSSQKREKLNLSTDGYMKWLRVRDKGYIPDDYWPQIMHQLFVTQIPAAVFLGLAEIRKETITKDQIQKVSILPDEKYIDDMLPRCQKFWNEVLKRRQDESKN